MDIIELARQIGRELQKDETYIKMRSAEQISEEDEELTELIGEYNLKRVAINYEASKTERDDEKMQALNKEMRSLYSKVMSNEKMKAYNDAKKDFDEKLRQVLTIIQNSALGADPDRIDPTNIGSCTGDCSSCGGCG